MSHPAIFRLKKHSSPDKIRNLQIHNRREYASKIPDNIRQEFTKYNREIVPLKKGSLLETVDAEISERVTGRVRRNSVRMVDMLLTAHCDFFKASQPGAELDETGRFDKARLDEWIRASMSFVEDLYGPENVVHAVLHLDEKTPHLHVCAVPVTKDGRLSQRDWGGDRHAFSRMQDKYHGFVQHLGLSRGRKGSVAKHRTIDEFGALLKQKMEAAPEYAPPPKKPGLLASAEEKEAYRVKTARRETFVSYVDRHGPALIAKAAGYELMKEERDRALEAGAKYKAAYEKLKARADLKELRAMPLSRAAGLLGYVSTGAGEEYVRDGVILRLYDDGRFSLSSPDGTRRGKGAIDLGVCALALESGRKVPPSEAAVELYRRGGFDSGDRRALADSERERLAAEAEEAIVSRFIPRLDDAKDDAERERRRAKRKAEDEARRRAEQEEQAAARERERRSENFFRAPQPAFSEKRPAQPEDDLALRWAAEAAFRRDTLIPTVEAENRQRAEEQESSGMSL